MQYLYKYYGLILLCILVPLQLSACATYTALKKVEPKEKILGYNSVYVSPEKEVIFNFVVRVKETQKEEIWCGKLPLEKILEYSNAVNQSIPWNSDESEAFYNSLPHLSDSHYNLTKSKCLCSDTDKIPYHEWGIGWIGEETLLWEKSAPVKFISPKFSIREMDYGYMVFNKAGELKVTKIELPLPVDVYDMKKIVLLPAYIVFDIVMTPVYLFFILFGPGHF
jgi:hypothetical protein